MILDFSSVEEPLSVRTMLARKRATVGALI